MKITKNVVPSIAYQVRTQDGVLVDEAPVNQPLEYLHGHNNLVEGLEKALEEKAVGDVFEVRVKPEEGYGEYNENMVQRVTKDVFMGVDELEVGMRFIADTDLGPLPVVITAVEGDEVVVDGNHMLAGQELLFSVEVVAIREATEEEIAHGHIHTDEHGCCGGHGDEEGVCCNEHDKHHNHGSCGCNDHH
ncbi:peptidylprolyl isomerase [[Haemophilus] ducreyi]|uniref:Peptidyl-prolyl cis-trans isomerase n=2 Tax=Haemophilus ducreyi TaxID=730 RepID=Q7VP93_HAEDU|nr:peptidylprolyl isomerase [[Haemophilus] ducreyi]AAP95194.1 FkbP-type peptidyl-prolyl cis-trans isomerase [[Haemophilus] ducreyi 35000HP]AKO30346.1 peptidylprolyl isomerase [[Haemophilus] ducreyi]AKO31778.1 peptidylprolyl isomerase [[Haemophilus] ducreyi]AKO33230.1 peptidylprolyl isomerase [[Haemophilus] ducreyi]AKO34680.1 peptidylprolyl isomerase [[Haemophilus] ducreyi]